MGPNPLNKNQIELGSCFWGRGFGLKPNLHPASNLNRPFYTLTCLCKLFTYTLTLHIRVIISMKLLYPLFRMIFFSFLFIFVFSPGKWLDQKDYLHMQLRELRSHAGRELTTCTSRKKPLMDRTPRYRGESGIAKYDLILKS